MEGPIQNGFPVAASPPQAIPFKHTLYGLFLDLLEKAGSFLKDKIIRRVKNTWNTNPTIIILIAIVVILVPLPQLLILTSFTGIINISYWTISGTLGVIFTLLSTIYAIICCPASMGIISILIIQTALFLGLIEFANKIRKMISKEP